MIPTNILVKNHFTNLNLLTSIDKKLIGDIFKRRSRSKVETSEKYVRNIIYEKSISRSDKNHEFYEEYKNLKVGQVDWYDNLSKRFKSYISWYLRNKYIFDKKDLMNNVSDTVYFAMETKCINYCVEHFYEEYLTDDGGVKEVILEDYYFTRKLPETYYERLIKLFKYAIEDSRSDLFIEEDVLDPQAILDYCMMEEKIPASVAEKIRVSVGRTAQNFDAYAKANIEKFKYFLTLTFADVNEKEKHLELNSKRTEDEYNLKFKYVNDIKSLELCNKSLNSFFTYLKKCLSNKGLELYYLGCPEYQSNGNVHYHFLISDIPEEFIYKVPSWLDYDFKNKQFQNGKGLIQWVYGKSDIELVKDKKRISSYISKYIIKSLEEIDGTVYFERLNKKRYYASRNLSKPDVIYDAVLELDDIDFEEYYISSRKSSFNDNEITDILFTLKGIEED